MSLYTWIISLQFLLFKKRNSSDKLRDRIVGKIYSLIFNNNMTLSVSFIKGKNNYFADSTSRSVVKNIHTEWSLGSDTVSLLKTKYGLQPDIDLFASHLNNIVPKFCSWYPCPGTFLVDCFNLDWSKFNCFMFPPFRLVSTCLWKIEQDKAKMSKPLSQFGQARLGGSGWCQCVVKAPYYCQKTRQQD